MKLICYLSYAILLFPHSLFSMEQNVKLSSSQEANASPPQDMVVTLKSMVADRELTPEDKELWHACNNNDTMAAGKLLIQKKAFTEIINETTKSTPLYLAVGHNNIALVTLLLQAGALVQSEILVKLALMHRNRELCLLLSPSLKMIKTPGLVTMALSIKDDDDNLSLQRIAQHFIIEGIPVNHEDLLTALERSFDSVVHLLLNQLFEHAEAEESRTPSIDVNARQADGTTALILAAKRNKTYIAERILALNAKCNDCDHNGATPLWFACYNNNTRLVFRLLECEAKADVAASPAKGSRHPFFKSEELWTPLLLAARHGNRDVLQALLRHNANVDATLMSEQNALHLAIESGSTETVREIVTKRAQLIHMPDKQGIMPLHVSCQDRTHYEITKFLIECEANPNVICPSDGNTVLHILAEKGFPEVFSVILQSSIPIDITRKNKKKETPLQIAERLDRQGIVILLDRYKIKPPVKSRSTGSLSSLASSNPSSRNVTPQRERTPSFSIDRGSPQRFPASGNGAN